MMAVWMAKKMDKVAGPISLPPRIQTLQPLANSRNIFQHSGANRNGPEGELVPVVADSR